MAQTQPPPRPRDPNPDFAARVHQTEEDGSLWRWTGSSWVMIDPPGTNVQAVRHHQVVMPFLSLAAELNDSGITVSEAAEALRAHPGCDREALLEAAAMYPDSATDRARQVHDLLSRLLLASDDIDEQRPRARVGNECLGTPIRIIRPSDSASRPTRDSPNPAASSGIQRRASVVAPDQVPRGPCRKLTARVVPFALAIAPM